MLAPLAALLAMPGLFTVSKLFFVRDLASSFLPHHLWFRHTVLSGQLPFWNPYPGCGYATLSDPVFQTFFPPTLPLRFLPATLGFNLIVALPFVVAALGAFRFLRRHVSLQAASLGAVVFCVSGPMLSTASTPNLSWSCACIPWILSASDRLAREATLRRVASLAAAFGVMLLAGEPVIFAATVALTAAYALVAGPIPPGGRRKATTIICTIAAMALGAALAAVQFFPTAMVTSRSIRAAGMLRDMWSLHPARVIEILSPFFFGKFVGMPHEITQWLFGLNDGREPLLVSLYLGAPVLLLAALGALSGRRNRWTLFWCGVAIAALIAAFGSHTPVYPALQRVLPALKLLRFPSKLFEISTLAIAILAALGWDALSRVPRPPRRLALVPIGAAVCLAVVGASVLLVIPAAEGRALDVAQQLGTRLGLPNPSAAAHSLLHACLAAAPRLLVLSLATGLGLLLATSARREGSIARGALFVLVCADLVLTNAPINPTIDASLLSPFDWTQITRSHATDRIFVSRNFVDAHQTMDDAAAAAEFPPDTPPVAYRAAYDAALENNLTLSSAGTTLSRELTGLRPREYFSLLQRFSASDRAMRYRFLSWAGTRYYLVTVAPPLAAKKIRELKALGSLAIYESAPAGGRVFIASSAVVEPNVERQIERLFQPDFPLASTILVESEPPSAAASAGPVGAPRAAIVDETATSIRVEATAAEGGGYLVLLDSFDPSWRAWVDDRSAPLVRADGVFRAVRVPAGRHTVRFAFRPNAFHIGAAISFVTGALLAAAAVWRR